MIRTLRSGYLPAANKSSRDGGKDTWRMVGRPACLAPEKPRVDVGKAAALSTVGIQCRRSLGADAQRSADPSGSTEAMSRNNGSEGRGGRYAKENVKIKSFSGGGIEGPAGGIPILARQTALAGGSVKACFCAYARCTRASREKNQMKRKLSLKTRNTRNRLWSTRCGTTATIWTRTAAIFRGATKTRRAPSTSTSMSELLRSYSFCFACGAVFLSPSYPCLSRVPESPPPALPLTFQ